MLGQRPRTQNPSLCTKTQFCQSQARNNIIRVKGLKGGNRLGLTSTDTQHARSSG